MKSSAPYLLVTHIPFARDAEGTPVVDGLWARDLIGLASANGPVRVAAPEVPLSQLKPWGPNTTVLHASTGIQFRGFQPVSGLRDAWRWPSIRAVLREEVRSAELVHTSNLFPPYLGLSYAHDLAVRLGKKTLFVIAEDFRDMLAWEWVRPARGFERLRRERALNSIDSRVRKSASSAALTFLHTPAAVDRYRLHARQSVAIRQPGHETEQVIPEDALEHRLQTLNNPRSLHLVSACRHAGLKGLDLLLRAVGLLKHRGIVVTATLYGQGPETGHLTELASQLGITEQVRMPGALPPGESLDAALRKADLFLMPHRSNDFGRAFFDAMAAGLPVLAFRTPASAETVYEGSDGFLTPLDDVQGLAERIGALHRDRVLLAGTARRARIRALENTRSEWFRIRSNWTKSLLEVNAHAA